MIKKWSQDASAAIFQNRHFWVPVDAVSEDIGNAVAKEMFGSVHSDDDAYEGIFDAIGRGIAKTARGLGKGVKAVTVGPEGKGGVVGLGRGVGKGAKTVAVGPEGKGGVVGLGRGIGRAGASVAQASMDVSAKRDERLERRLERREDRRGRLGYYDDEDDDDLFGLVLPGPTLGEIEGSLLDYDELVAEGGTDEFGDPI